MTRNNIQRILRMVAVLALAAFALPTWAQTPERLAPPPTLESENYLFNLGLTAGYRSATITDQNNATSDWANNRYYEAANFRTGLNVQAFSIFGERKSGQSGFFDEAYLTAAGLNDPFTDATLRLRAFHSYDLKVDFRQAKYFLDRLNPSSTSMIYSGLHDFDFKRQFVNASLSVEATEDLNIAFKLNRSSRSGSETNTFSPSYLGSDEGLVGGYARGNFFWMNVPLDDATNEYTAEAKYKIASTTSLTIGGGFRQFDQSITPGMKNDTSLNFYSNTQSMLDWIGIVGTNKNFEPLLTYKYSESRSSKTPIGYLEIVSRPIDDLSITANFRYEDQKEDVTMSMPDATGTMGAAKVAYRSYLEGTGSITSKTMIGALALDARVIDGLSVGAQYRYTNLDNKSNGDYTMGWDTAKTMALVLAKQQTLGEASSVTSYQIPQHYLQGFVDYRPMNEIGMRAGIIMNMRLPNVDRVDNEDGTISHDSAFNVNLSKHTTATTPYFSFNARPVSDLKLNGRYSHTDTKATFNGDVSQTPSNIAGSVADIPIRIIPKSKDEYSIGADYNITEEIGIGARYLGNTGKTEFISMAPGGSPAHSSQSITNAVYDTKLQRIQGNLTYAFMKNSTFVVSYDFDKNDMTIPTTWTRGIGNATRPYGDSMTSAIDQHTIDRQIDATINTRPVDPLGIEFGMSYMVSTGGPSVTQDVVTNPTPGGAAYAPDITRFGGPYDWIQFHGSVSYEVTPNIGLQFDFQYYSLKEQQVLDFIATNNFKASLYQGGVVVRL